MIVKLEGLDFFAHHGYYEGERIKSYQWSQKSVNITLLLKGFAKRHLFL